MNILSSAISSSNTHTGLFPNKSSTKKNNLSLSSPLKSDTVSFKGYNHLRLDGFDSVCASDFKLHLEKFKNKEAFDDWARQELTSAFDLTKYEADNKELSDERKSILTEWKTYLESDESEVNMKKEPALSLLIFSSITKKLKADNFELPPIFAKDVLIRTVSSLDARLKSNKNALFNFEKTYRSNMCVCFVETEDAKDKLSNKNGWVKIDSLKNDEKHFKENVKKLKMLSSRGWCLKSGSYASDYLSYGDFHLYFADGKPKVGIRMIDNKVAKIQGSLNNDNTPANYYDEIENYINQNNFDTSEVTKELQKAKRVSKELNKVKADIAPMLKKKDYSAVFKYFGIEVKEQNRGKLLALLGLSKNQETKKTISHYAQPSDFYSYSDLGISENELLKNVVKIEKDATFKKSEATDLSSLIEIGGDADFEESPDIDISNLKTIGKDAYFSGSRIKNISSLETVGGSLFYTGAKDVNLSSLTSIGKDGWFDSSQNLDLSSLKEVKGKLWLNYAKKLKISPQLN